MKRVEVWLDPDVYAAVEADRIAKGQTLAEWMRRAVQAQLDALKAVKVRRVS
jgi:hypothetical protein